MAPELGISHPSKYPVNIRTAIPQDYAAIASIYNEAIEHGGITMDGQPYTAQKIADIIHKMSQRETLLVAEISGEVIGWGIVKAYSDRIGYQVCCETSIYLTFTQTGKGYGRALQQALMDKVSAFGYHHIVAKIVAANQGSVEFHKQFGFEVVGVQKEIGFMHGAWHDVVIMQYLFSDD